MAATIPTYDNCPDILRMMERGRAFLGTNTAIMCGAMTWVSHAPFVIALAKAGAFGVIASGGVNPQQVREQIQAVKAATDAPFGVNLITMDPKLMEHIDVCLDEGVAVVVLAGGLPPRDAIARIKEGGGKVMAFAPALALAKRMIRQGVDAFVIEGSEAGGHIGPVSTSVLVQEILPHIPEEIPVFVAGGIGDGRMMAHYVAMGAAGVQLGTRFAVAEESPAHPDFKRALTRAGSRDAVPTSQFDPALPVIPVRALVNQGTERFNALQLELLQAVKAGTKAKEEAQLEMEHFWAGSLRRAVQEGDVDGGSLMAGQSVGLVNKVEPVAEIVRDLMELGQAHWEKIGKGKVPA